MSWSICWDLNFQCDIADTHQKLDWHFIVFWGRLDKVRHEGNPGDPRPRDHQQWQTGHHSQWQGLTSLSYCQTFTLSPQDTWTLTLRNVQTTDRGPYMCQVNSTPVKIQVAHLEVVIPPRIEDEQSSTDVAVPEGGSVKLHCKALGFPEWVNKLNISSYRDNLFQSYYFHPR